VANAGPKPANDFPNNLILNGISLETVHIETKIAKTAPNICTHCGESVEISPPKVEIPAIMDNICIFIDLNKFPKAVIFEMASLDAISLISSSLILESSAVVLPASFTIFDISLTSIPTAAARAFL